MKIARHKKKIAHINFFRKAALIKKVYYIASTLDPTQ